MARPKLYEEKRILTAIRIPESLHREVRRVAEEREISVNLLVVRAIKSHLAQLPPLDVVRDEKPA